MSDVGVRIASDSVAVVHIPSDYGSDPEFGG
jgi:hypothetical protein